MERSRSFSNSWSDRRKSPRIATVKPVSKSFSEDNLLKATDDDQSHVPQRVFSRLKVQDITSLKKDNIISELEKCLLELENEHGYAQHLGDVYEKVETERNQLLDELDMAFQDLQLYMQKQKTIEDEKATVEYDREELNKENEYLKEVLSNRNEILNNKLQEENRHYQERVKELEAKNSQHLDEINELYEERQTLINSLLNLQSSAVDDVIRKTSRSSSLCSRESLEDLGDVTISSSQVKDLLEQTNEGNIDIEAFKKALKEIHTENEELKDAFKRIRKERDTAESEIDNLREEKDHIDQMYAEKIKEYQALQEDRNEKNLNLSKLNLEKRTLQRQYDHMRESNRALNGKISSLTQELETFRDKGREQRNTSYSKDDKYHNEEHGKMEMEFNEKLKAVEHECKELKVSKENLENQLKIKAELAVNLNKKYDIESNENKAMHNVVESLSKELDELKSVSAEKYRDLIVEFDNVRNKNQQLQHTIEKIRLEKESIKSELSNYKSDVIEKIKENLDSLEQERINILSRNESLEVSALQQSDAQLKEVCCELLKHVDEHPKSRSSPCDTDDNMITVRKYDVLKKDYDRMLIKCRQLEKSAADCAGLDAEVKRLNEVNEMLLQRYRSLESDYNSLLNESNKENKTYSELSSNYEKKCKQYDLLCEQSKCLENERKKMCAKHDKLDEDNSLIHKQYNELHDEYRQICDRYDLLVEEKNNSVTEMKSYSNDCVDVDNNNKIGNKNNNSNCLNSSIDEHKNMQKEDSSTIEDQKVINRLQSENSDLQNLNSNLHVEKGNLENFLISLREEVKKLKEHIKNIEDKRIMMESNMAQVEQEKSMVKTKYDLLRVDFEKVTKEKTHLALTSESLREENRRLNETVRKQCLLSSSGRDEKIKQLRSENESLLEKMEVLQANLGKSSLDNKTLLDRINRSDETMASTLRTLKARKTELQLQVESLKYENDYLKKLPKIKEKKHKFGKSSGEKNSEIHLNESLKSAHVKMAEFQVENGELKHKLRESEGLLYGLQQALAHANDLAMQKNLEGSKMKRSLERKVEKLSQENTELRRIIFLLDDSSMNNRQSTSSVRQQGSTSSAPETQRKSSEHSVVNITFSTDSQENDKSETDQPQLISVSRVSSSHSDNMLPSFSYESPECDPDSPRLTSSRQAENDLSMQLRELLDISNDLRLPDDDQKSILSEESIAPPVPPPPPNYESSSRGYIFRMPFFRMKRK